MHKQYSVFRFWLFNIWPVLFLFCLGDTLYAQPVTGVWRGRITRGSGFGQGSATVEIKLIAQGDSIVGTSYYYGRNAKSYIRYSLKGYFGKDFNTVFWQDYHMIDMVPQRPQDAQQFRENMKVEADFSCPDGRIMRLDGKSILPDVPDMKIELRKMDESLFPDEWDEVIEGYFTGMARTDVVDSVWQMYSEKPVQKELAKRVPDDAPVAKTDVPAGIKTPEQVAAPKTEIAAAPPPKDTTLQPPPVVAQQKAPPAATRTTPDITEQIAKARREQQAALPPPAPAAPAPQVQEVKPVPPPAIPPAAVVVAPPVIANPVMENAFKARQKVIQTTIPAVGDSIELRFYDNADVDGDSISLFLNGKPLFQHVRLDVRPYIFKIAVADLPAISELAMVAENLGAIPPNTAFMEAFSKGKRYTARLESTEVTTGVIRLVKEE